MQALKHIKILMNTESYTCFQLGLPEVECIESAEEKNLGNEKIIKRRNSSGGLCNGTRLNIKNLYKYNIEAVISNPLSICNNNQ